MISLQLFQKGKKKEKERRRRGKRKRGEEEEEEGAAGSQESLGLSHCPCVKERRLGGNDLGRSSKAICESLSEGQ